MTPPPTDPSADATRQQGEALMRRRRWAEAAAAFGRIAERDASTEIKRRLSANLASLQRHRPDVYETLVALPTQQQYTIAATAVGKPTVVGRRPDGALVSLSSGNDPLAAAAAAKQRIHSATPSGESVGLCGVGDGYLLGVLAHNPPALFMDKQQPVFLLEPEPQVLLQCLMVHDYAGERGPIEQARFRWFVGGGWDTRLEAALLDDLYLPGPGLMVGQGFDSAATQARVRSILQELGQLDADLAAEVDRRYAGASAADFAERFDGPTRRPRVLLLTTRFSTVLQYSTRDTAAAFERLGWDARVVIEPTPHHRVLRTALRAALAEFEPDLVFQIDHLRHEHNGLFPAGLPFACWIQDHLPHLASADVGRRVGPTDFVLTDATATYVDKFAYPVRQCIALPKLTVRAPAASVGARLVSPSPVGNEGDTSVAPTRQTDDDIVFVSNASQTPEAMIASALATFGQSPSSRELVTETCRRIVDTYAAGASLPTYGDVCGALNGALTALSLKLPTEDFDRLARWLTHPFNDALYRQQALRWARDAANDLGVSFALYGKGWEAHPDFAPFAHGPVAYGEALAELTRRAAINLQIVPYLCLHQRLLDGLMAGGFFLVRTHPADVAPANLLNFLHENVDPALRTAPAVAASLPLSVRGEFDALLAACRPCLCTTGQEDVVTMVRDWQDGGQLVPGEGPLPLLEQTGFDDAPGLRARLERFVDDAPLRRSVTAAQRSSVARRLTYDAGIARVVRRMRGLLSETQTAEPIQRRALAA